MGSLHSAIEHMAEVVEKVVGVQQEHLVASEVVETFFADIATLATRARQVVASTEAQALDSVVKELEGVVSFMRSGCLAAFTV